MIRNKSLHRNSPTSWVLGFSLRPPLKRGIQKNRLGDSWPFSPYLILFSLCLMILIPGFLMADDKDSDKIEEASLDLDSIIKKVETELEELRTKAVQEQDAIQTERMKLLEELEPKTQTWESIKESLAREKRLNSTLNSQLTEKKDQLFELNESRDEYLGILKVKATELAERLNSTIVGYERKDLRKRANELAQKIEGENPDLVEATQELFYLTNEELKSGSEVNQFKGQVIAPGGNLVNADILRVGEIGNFCILKDGTKGLLVRTADGQTCLFGRQDWRMISDRLGYFQRKRVKNFLDQVTSGNTGIMAMPLDITGGLAIAQREFSRTFSEYLKAGGIVMVPLVLIAILGILIAIERLVSLARIHLGTGQLADQVDGLCRKGKYQEAESLCNSISSPVSRVLKTGLSHRTSSKDVLEDVLEESILHELPRLEKFLSTLGVLAVIAPFLGLLGTVTGMISTFNVITLYGTGDPKLLSGGISEALITTQVGLIIAIPLLLLHNYISSRVTHITGDMETNATRLVNILSVSNQRKEI